MSEVKEITVNVGEYLALDKLQGGGGERTSARGRPDIEEFLKLVRVCPAALYKIDEDGRVLRLRGLPGCGTCPHRREGTIVKKWENPRLCTMGVEYRFG